MADSFDSIAFAEQIGQELVAAFQLAGFATTPGLIGSAREVPVKDKLAQILPRGIGVGSGCVIDSFGSTSRQMDIVLYEQDICPVYAVNQDPASTYYPCEGVMAVGEIKSSIASRELEDIFGKIESVKSLRRFTRLSSGGGEPGVSDYVAYRKYGSLLSIANPRPGDYNQDMNPTDQIYAFSLAGRIELSYDTLCSKYVEFAVETGYSLSPNLVVALDGSILCPLSVPPNRHNPTITVSPQEANSIYCVRHPGRSFPFLLARLQTMYTTGRTVEALAFERYFAEEGRLSLPSDGTLKLLPGV